ncbi:MAG: hypothetical protein JSV18_00400 [Candidatus Bathyarchaeota archaeon]|nr:MAG: hypothetical protein JSV18_00400 [Candidatus Bathyarchaeota archaeon]
MGIVEDEPVDGASEGIEGKRASPSRTGAMVDVDLVENPQLYTLVEGELLFIDLKCSITGSSQNIISPFLSGVRSFDADFLDIW